MDFVSFGVVRLALGREHLIHQTPEGLWEND
jgi:hypothetical protein